MIKKIIFIIFLNVCCINCTSMIQQNYPIQLDHNFVILILQDAEIWIKKNDILKQTNNQDLINIGFNDKQIELLKNNQISNYKINPQKLNNEFDTLLYFLIASKIEILLKQHKVYVFDSLKKKWSDYYIKIQKTKLGGEYLNLYLKSGKEIYSIPITIA